MKINIPVKITIHLHLKQIRRVEIEQAPSFTCSFEGEDTPKVVELVHQWIAMYSSGIQPTIRLPFDFSGIPPFAAEVLRAMQKIPFGEVVSYGELANLAGSPRGARPAGTACSRNPFPFFIPCHRVIKSDGSIGGYNSGLDIKQALLKFENQFKD